MELNKYIDIQPEIAEALTENLPVVALESTILSHGMPYPENLDFAAEVERAVRSEGAIPATMAIVCGRVKIGLTNDELELMCKAENVGKVSRRDFAIYVAEGRDGATTVASTMMCCAYAGIQVFATGGIGGVHRHGEVTMDVSADLQELAHTNVAVVCAGAKQILDIGRTLEYLETMGVPVIGNGTNDFPAFYCRKSGYGVDYANLGVETANMIASILLDGADPAATAVKTFDNGTATINTEICEQLGIDFDELSEKFAPYCTKVQSIVTAESFDDVQ